MPVIRMVNVPRLVDPVVRTLRVEVPGAVTGLVVKLAKEPAGSPLTERETLPLNPPRDETDTA